MPQSMVDPEPMKSFQAWMLKTFERVCKTEKRPNKDGKMETIVKTVGYTVVAPQSRRYNCIAHAINLNDVRLTPMTLDNLITYYSQYGFYRVPLDSSPSAGDAEVYAKDNEPGVPLHAHQVVGPGARGSKPEEIICSSKMGDDFLIRHPRNLLQCPHTGSNRYEYGKVCYRFRHNASKFAIQQASVTKTRSGRTVKQSETVLTKSMSRIRKTDETRTNSNRITKKPRK